MDTCPCCDSDKASQIQQLIRALGCPCRWRIIRILGKSTKSTEELYQKLKQQGEKFTKQGLYYHLSALHKAGLIEVADYKEEKGGAPEKLWKLKKDKVVLNLLAHNK